MSELLIEGYEELKEVARGFVSGDLPNVIVVGPPGTMKTTTVGRIMPDPHVKESGMVSAYSLYRRLYENRNQLLLLDDVEEFLGRTTGQELIRSLTEHSTVKTLQWRTKQMLKEGVPSEFTTSTRCLIIANRIGNTGVWQSLRSRCHVVRYEPTWDEFLFTVREQGIFNDEEILNFAFENQAILGSPDLRRLKRAWEVKNSGIANRWQDVLGRPVEDASKWETNAAERTQAVHSLLEDHSFESTEERVKQFVEMGYGSRSTFFHYASLIRSRKEKASEDMAMAS